MNNALTDINIVRLTRDTDFVRFESARDCAVATMHSSADHPMAMSVEEARERIERLVGAGWEIAEAA